ncbi:DUF2283 domain-containing protein [Candidatus Parcubacteria bacterium]|nr:DUF2283 domain-containing protein [Candidatus Parcubacteria bacterium]
MKITYDKSVDAMYIKLNENAVYKNSKKITDDVLIDYGEKGQVIGVEILSASENSLAPLSETSIPIELKASL